jgi:hypothetical protein
MISILNLDRQFATRSAVSRVNVFKPFCVITALVFLMRSELISRVASSVIGADRAGFVTRFSYSGYVTNMVCCFFFFFIFLCLFFQSCQQFISYRQRDGEAREARPYCCRSCAA